MADLLEPSEIKTQLRKIPEWEVEKKRLERVVEFDDFAGVIDFVNSVAEIAEDQEHHPDIDIRYNKVKLSLHTQNKGGITDMDFQVAQKIDTLLE